MEARLRTNPAYSPLRTMQITRGSDGKVMLIDATTVAAAVPDIVPVPTSVEVFLTMDYASGNGPPTSFTVAGQEAADLWALISQTVAVEVTGEWSDLQ